MKNLFFIFLYLFAVGPLVGHSEELKCRKGDEAMTHNYTHAISLIQGGTRLSEVQEKGVVHSLELAVSNQCQQAALVLAEIRINQVAALPKGGLTMYRG